MTNEELVQIAGKACECAYAPYSNFRVGAALLTKSGNVYRGCNIENVSYGATVCAERIAFFSAISQGERDFERIAIVAGDGSTAYPCGMCLQVMHEFMPDGFVVVEKEGIVTEYSLKELLPYGFSMENE